MEINSNKKLPTLAVRLMLLLGMGGLATIIVIFTLSYPILFHNLQDEIFHQNKENSYKFFVALNQTLYTSIEELGKFSKESNIGDEDLLPTNVNRILSIKGNLQKEIKENGIWKDFYLIDEEGNNILNSSAEKKDTARAIINQKDIFHGAINKKSGYLLFNNENSGNEVLCVLPILNKSSILQKVLIGVINPIKLQTIFGDSSSLIIFNEEGEAILKSHNINNYLVTADELRRIFESAIEGLNNDGSDGERILTYKAANNDSYIISSIDLAFNLGISSTNLVLVNMTSKDVIFNNIKEYMFYTVAALIAIVSIVSLGVFLLIDRKISRPLKDLLKSAEGVMKGESMEIIEITSENELASLSKLLRKIINDLTTSCNDVLDANIKLGHNEARIKSILNSIIDGIITFDEAGIIKSFSPASETIFGYKEEEVVGKEVRILLDEASYNKFYPTITAYITEKSTLVSDKGLKLELIATRNDRKSFSAAISLSKALQNNGNNLCIIVVRDITEFKAQEAEIIAAKEWAERLSAAKSDFLSNMSHEMRTPMNGVMVMCDLLLTTLLDEEQTTYVETIKESSENFNSLLSDILNFSDLESKKDSMRNTRLDLRQLIDEVVEVATPLALKKDIKFINYVSPNLVRCIFGNYKSTKQVLNNLVNNAIKFTNEGEVKFSIDNEIQQEGRVLVTFIVEDSGIGIAENKIAKIFEAFSQVDNTDKRQFGGAGLGLAIVKKIVDLLGATLTVDSIIGKGSKFTFKIVADIMESRVESISTDKQISATDSDSTKNINRNLKELKAMVLVSDDVSYNSLATLFTSCMIQFKRMDTEDEFIKEILNGEVVKSPYNLAIIDKGAIENKTILEKIRENNSRIELVVYKLSEDNDVYKTLPGVNSIITTPIEEDKALLLLNKLQDKVRGKIMEQNASPGEKIKKANFAILVAEDHPMNQQLTIVSLKKLGFENVQMVSNGKEAIEAASKRDFDVILMDCQMPELDGFEATMKIRELEREKNKKRAKIIALTADIIKTDKSICLNYGMDDYLNKPLNLLKLRDLLNVLIAVKPE